jgi:hypothetical protein
MLPIIRDRLLLTQTAIAAWRRNTAALSSL